MADHSDDYCGHEGIALVLEQTQARLAEVEASYAAVCARLSAAGSAWERADMAERERDEALNLVRTVANAPRSILGMLQKATIRLEILQGRMRACGQHDVSMLEIEGWIEEQKAAINPLGKS